MFNIRHAIVVMPVKSHFSVRTTIVLLAVGFMTLLSIVGMTIWLVERTQDYANQAFAARDTRTAAVELRNAIQTAESSQRGYAYTGNEIYLAPYSTAKTVALRQLMVLKDSLVSFPQTQVALQRLETIIIEKVDEMDTIIALKRERHDPEALATTRTNRGKALIDEANVFFAGIIRTSDESLNAGVRQQRANASWLRWISIMGGFVIVGVVASVIFALFRYTCELSRTRDEVTAFNTKLEERVQNRTADLAQARDRAQLLLAEVNHRVANSLSLVASLVRLQANVLTDKAAKIALGETQARIYAVASVHKSLYSSGDVRFVAMHDYLSSLLEHLEISMRDEGHGASLKYDIEPFDMPTDATINLGVIVAELVTNAFKYAYPDRVGEIRVRLRHLLDKQIELTVEDDGVGRHESAEPKGTGLGTKIVKTMAASLGAQINYSAGDPGTAARLVFSL